MFKLVLQRTRPQAEVDRHLAAHRTWLAAQYRAGHFVLSSKQEAPGGGLLLARGASRAVVQALVASDPLCQAGVARYEISELTPSASATLLRGWLQR